MDRLEALITERLAPYEGEILRYEETALRESPSPELVPARVEMHVDAADRLWVRRFACEGLDILEIGADHVLGVARTEDDVPIIRLHRID